MADYVLVPVDPAAGWVCAGVRYHRPRVHRVQKHHIWPKGWGGPVTESDTAWHDVWEFLCGSCHDTVHELLDLYCEHQGTPPLTVRARYPRRLRDLAAEGWRRDIQATG